MNRPARLEGKVAIVTGGSQGLGRATALRMAEEGAAVAVLDILDETGEVFARELSERQLRARYWHCDVTREADVKHVVDEAAAEFGRIDILVNNAGIGGANKPTHEITEEEWDLVQAINVKGVFFFTKHAIPHLKRAGGGSIINISSIYGLVGSGSAPPYHASKGAVRLMSKTDALLYAPDNIRVNSIHPGFIRTPLVENGLAQQPDAAEMLKQLIARHPIGRIGEPDDIAWGAVYLASDQARFVTGSELVIDGGYTAQ